MTGAASEIDPRGLIREAYRMEIGPAECRSILLDWALGLAQAGPEEIAKLLDIHAAQSPDHPMTAVLREGLGQAPAPRRRGRRVRDRSAVPRVKEN